MNLVDELHAIAAALAAAGIEYAVCGGVEVTIHGHPRATKDIDVVVRAEDLDRVLVAVQPVGFRFVADPMVFDRGTPRERHVRRVTKIAGTEHLTLDLLLAEAAFADALDGVLEVNLPEGPLRVVSRETLIQMKKLASRNQDLADLQNLERPDEP
jgi:hypothetical protein